MPNDSGGFSPAARTTGVLLVSSDPSLAATAHEAACSPAAVLSWVVHIGGALALCEPAPGASAEPSGGAPHVALLAARVNGVPHLRPVPAPVRAAFAAHRHALAARLTATRATLVRRGMTPAELEGAPGARVLTLSAWGESMRADFDAADWAAWAHFAARPLAHGVASWLAGVAAVQGLIGTRSPRRGVRARHRAAVRAASGL